MDDLGLVEAVDGFGESIDAPMSVKSSLRASARAGLCKIPEDLTSDVAFEERIISDLDLSSAVRGGRSPVSAGDRAYG